MRLRTFIVEDEPPATARLRTLLAEAGEIEIVGESAGTAATVEALREARPDVVFLDLHVPAGDGFSLLEQARLDPPPAIVVVTAHGEHAVEAFDRRATDYLLKPYRSARLHAALDRVREQVAGRTAADRTDEAAAESPGYLVRFVVRNERQLEVVAVEAVDWLASAGNYVILHAGHTTHVLREAMIALEQRLDPSRFVRISRSAVVALDRVRSVVTDEKGNSAVILRDGTKLPLTRGVRELQQRLEHG